MARSAFVVCLIVLAASACAPPPPGVSEPVGAVPAAGSVRVAGVVLKWLQADKQRNLERLEVLIRTAAANGAQVVVTTESAVDGYAIAAENRSKARLAELAEDVPDGPLVRRLAQLADELDLVLVVGLLERDEGRTHNAVVLLGPAGEWIGTYRKRKLGFEAGFNEPGDEAPVFETPHGKLGVLICADRTVARYALELSAKQPDFLVCPSGGFFGDKNDRIVSSRSRQTHLPLVFVHPVEFLVTDRRGQIVQRSLLGDSLWIDSRDEGGSADSSAVFFVDLPVD